jgi:ribose transport system substrate-binding protein
MKSQRLLYRLSAVVVIVAMAITLAPMLPNQALAQGKDTFHFVYVPKLVHPWYDEVKRGADETIAEFAKMGITVTYDWDVCIAVGEAGALAAAWVWRYAG